MISNKSSDTHPAPQFRYLPKRETKPRRVRHRHVSPVSCHWHARLWRVFFCSFRTLLHGIPLHFRYADANHVRSWLQPRTICNFPLDMRQEFRDILYPRPMPPPRLSPRRTTARRDKSWAVAAVFLPREGNRRFSFVSVFRTRPLVSHARTAIESQRSCAIREIRGCIHPRILVCDAFDD